ncbi:hypothetical protein [Dysgonomonas sp. Marseille-P4361]|uniref:hypothetical protein n=1 Tax=Dysgonomonas sp. Marseille-P4361 TaxID=2161820 RepID=UPI000D54D458|nr:hypothetical protein [Dysgonomonas sp. Marseille-P4361]
MKKLLTLFMCLALVGLYSCSDDEDNGGGTGDKLTLTVTSLYKEAGDNVTTYPDKGSKVYLFFDVNGTSNDYNYEVGGKYKKGESKINADQSATTGTDGKVKINAEFKNKPLTVVVESAKYPGQYYEKYISDFFESEFVDVAFSPQ